ncbi:MAG: hypothetical protein SFZ03_05065 [Candidatus Melainabacteria bacterium]|nr:hypothetical protein [Candidatus Melainabacteria bacterium]
MNHLRILPFPASAVTLSSPAVLVLNAASPVVQQGSSGQWRQAAPKPTPFSGAAPGTLPPRFGHSAQIAQWLALPTLAMLTSAVSCGVVWLSGGFRSAAAASLPASTKPLSDTRRLEMLGAVREWFPPEPSLLALSKASEASSSTIRAWA